MKLDIPKVDLSPQELDAQSPVVIDKWVDIDSEECKSKDPDYIFYKRHLASSAESKSLFFAIDSQGRIWCRGLGEEFLPYHFEADDKLYGIRIAASAAN